MTLGLYLSRVVGARIAATLVALLLLALALDLLDNATDLLAQGGPAHLLLYAGLRSAPIAVNLLPVAVLVGTMVAFLTLAARSELVILRSGGMNTLRLLRILAPLGLIIGIGYNLLVDRAAVRAEAAIAEAFPEMADAPADLGVVWARGAREIVRFSLETPGGKSLRDVTIFQLDPAGAIEGRLNAAHARYEDGEWTLEDVSGVSTDGARTQAGSQRWMTDIRPADVVTLARKPRQVGAEEARRVLAGEAYGARGTPFFRTRVLRSYAALATPFALIVFASLAGFGLLRSGGNGRNAAIGLGLGFGFIALDGLLSSFGEAGAISPALAAFGAAVIAYPAGLWVLLVFEE